MLVSISLRSLSETADLNATFKAAKITALFLSGIDSISWFRIFAASLRPWTSFFGHASVMSRLAILREITS